MMEGKTDKSAASKPAIEDSAANQSSDAADQIHQAGGQGKSPDLFNFGREMIEGFPGQAASAVEPVPEHGANENYSIERWVAQDKKDDGVSHYQP
jgi:hypothetical protein